MTAEEDKKFLPVEDTEKIRAFSEAFGFDRTEYGLSVLIPAVHASIEHKSMLEAVLEDYYWPILRGNLTVEIIDLLSGQHTHASVDTIDDSIASLKDEVKAARLNRLTQIARTIMRMKDGHPDFFQGIQPIVEGEDERSKRATLKASCFFADHLDLIKSSFVQGKMVGVQFSVELLPVDGPAHVGVFEVFLQAAAADSRSGISQFIRNGIIISEQRDNITGRYGSCFVLVEDREMSDYLGLAEGPAHTKWLLGKLNEHKKYQSDWPLRFAMDAARELYRILVGEDQDKDKIDNFAADIFSINKPSSDPAHDRTKNKGKRTDKPAPPKPDRVVELIRVEREQSKTGFSLLPVRDMDQLMNEEGISFPITVNIEAAYFMIGGNARSFKDYSPIDFDFANTIKFEVTPENAAQVKLCSGNKLEVEVLDSIFEVTASGFDKHRDLLIKINLKVGG